MQETTSELFERARAARNARVALARRDPDTFCELVLRDEFSGKSVVNSSCHSEWHEAATARERLVIWAHIESGKTAQMAIGRTIWEIGRNRNIRIAIVSNTYHQAETSVKAIGEYISTNEMVRTVFPNLQKGEPWTSNQITVVRPVIAKDPTLQACGVHGNILGARLDLIILDDVLDYENTLTARQRQDLWDWFHSTLAGRLTRRGRVIAIGTAWHPEDLLHRFEKMPGWHCIRTPVQDKHGKPSWPEVWPRDRIDGWKLDNGPLEFARQLLCKARDDSESRFKQTWIDESLKLGDGLRPVQSAEELGTIEGLLAPWSEDKPDEEELEEALDGAARILSDNEPLPGRFYTGVDLAIQKHDAADETVLFTIYVRPEDGKRQVCEVLAGKWSGPEIVQKIFNAHDRFGSICIVENNSAQDFILQFAREANRSIPILPFTTGKNKAHPEFGVESLAAEFAAGKWIIPNTGGRCEPQIREWLQELLYYDPRGHTGDRLMGAWFAREAARRAERGAPVVSARVIG